MGEWKEGKGPHWPLHLGAKMEAPPPCLCSIWERSQGHWPHPGVGRDKRHGRGRGPHAHRVHVSPDPGEERSPSHSPTSHIPSASLGNNHTPHTEETQSTDSGFLDTPVASKNSQAMTKQIGVWTAHNSSTSLPGGTRGFPCWALPSLPSPVSETVSCC